MRFSEFQMEAAIDFLLAFILALSVKVRLLVFLQQAGLTLNYWRDFHCLFAIPASNLMGDL